MLLHFHYLIREQEKGDTEFVFPFSLTQTKVTGQQLSNEMDVPTKTGNLLIDLYPLLPEWGAMGRVLTDCMCTVPAGVVPAFY